MASERDVLHALAMAGIASPTRLAESVESSEAAVGATLDALADDGLVEGDDDLLYLTDAGDERLTELCRDRFDDAALADLEACLDEFEALDDRVKELATAWQETQDDALVDDLQAVHADVEALFGVLDADAAGPFDPYRRDLAAAIAALRDGDEAYFTGTDVDSYHEVWFRLHDDMLRTLGAGRHA